MSTANLVPETWNLTDDDAKKTLAHIGRRRLVKDALTRLRFSDGFSHARSMAYLGILLFVEGVIAAVGISSALGILLLIAAIALILRWTPRRHQPKWSWMSFGAAAAVALMAFVTIVLNVFFHFSSSFGTTYGPLAGIIALAFWAYFTSIALLMGAALAAQLEAVRAGAGAPRSDQKTRGQKPSSAPATGSARPRHARPDGGGARTPAPTRRGPRRDAAAWARRHDRRAGHRGELGRGPAQRQR